LCNFLFVYIYHPVLVELEAVARAATKVEAVVVAIADDRYDVDG
jgi:hypothetical protein